MNEVYSVPNWSRALGGPAGLGVIRSHPDDFFVEELPGFELSGAGEHAFLEIEKCAENTDFIVHQLANFAGVAKRDIGYAGLKDRHARTRQWFSVWLPGKQDPDWSQFNSDTYKVLSVGRHAKKLKRGVLAGNKFKLLIREWQGNQEQSTHILEKIKASGVPNYYGSQRFGRDGQNVNKALDIFSGKKVGRHKRGLYLSAVRSYLFNQILQERIKQQVWDVAIPGDILIFNHSNSFFKGEFPDEDINRRIKSGTIHPAGALWGNGDQLASVEALSIEQQIFKQYTKLTEGLEASGLEMDQRALRVNVQNLHWKFLDTNKLFLEFALPGGSYATSVLRELIDI